MSADTTHPFPPPVGGVPLPVDLGPSILFSLLFACLIPIAIWRVADPRTRSYALVGTIPFCVERVVLYALRAHAAQNEGARMSKVLEMYFQTSLANGLISMGQDLLLLLRSLLVYSTLGTTMQCTMKFTQGSNLTLAERNTEESSGTVLFEGEIVDQPRTRAYIRRICDTGALLFLATMGLMIAAGTDYKKVIVSGDHAELIRRLWYAGNAIAVFLVLSVAHGAAWAFLKLRRIPRNSVLWTILVAALLSVVGCYRLSLLRRSTTSIFTDGSNAQNTRGSKTAFYIFHAAPEFLSAAILVSLDVRRTFATGLWGDRRAVDPKSSKEIAVKSAEGSGTGKMVCQ